MTQPADTPHLSSEDIARLLRDPSDANRARVARKVGAGIASESLTARERAAAEEIIRVFARDAVVHVRIALAESVKSNKSLPRDIAKKLASDVAEVALPIVQFSQSLTDEDLIEIVRGGDAQRQRAIAARQTISPAVAESVIDHGDKATVVVLLENKNAKVREISLTRALDRFGSDPVVPDVIALRGQLPPAITERLLDLVSESLQVHLMARFNMAPETAKKVAGKARDHAIGVLYTNKTASTDPFLRARELAAARRLTSEVVLQSLCASDLPFFEACLAVMAGISLSNARVLAYDTGPLGLRSLLQKADIPSGLLPMFRVAMAIVKESGPTDDADGALEQRREIAIRVINKFADSRHSDVERLLSKLDNYWTVREIPSAVVHFAAGSAGH